MDTVPSDSVRMEAGIRYVDKNYDGNAEEERKSTEEQWRTLGASTEKKITGSLDCQRGCNQKLLNNYIYALK